jgi:IS5 family transposase
MAFQEGACTKKNNTSHFGNKLHTVHGTDLPLIMEFVVTTASSHLPFFIAFKKS